MRVMRASAAQKAMARLFASAWGRRYARSLRAGAAVCLRGLTYGATGCGRYVIIYYHGSNFFAGEHRSCVPDGRATTRHLHGRTERGARCATVKVSAESADAVSR